MCINKMRIIFLFWREWHHRNNVVHDDGKASITGSVNFLQSYLVSLEGLDQVKIHVKGKCKLIPDSNLQLRERPRLQNGRSHWRVG
jgi:hypothetical protein